MEIPVREKFRELPVLQFISNLLAFMESGNFRIGAKTTRGYGKLSLNQLCFRDLKLDGVEAMKEYLNFRWEKLAGKTPETLPEPTYVNPYTCITIPLHAETLLIRNYVMDNTAADGSNLNVNCEQLHVNGRAAIPGSAWAGIFRHKASEFLRELAPEKEKKLISELFGTDKEEVDEKRKSKVIFDESYDTKDGKSRFRDVMRTKIDRFSGGVCKGALFGERLAVGCDFEPELRVRDKKDYEIGLLLLVAKEIGSGLAAVGGTTGVGRGVMKENGYWKCDGVALTEKEIQAYWDALAKKLEEEA